MLRRALYFLILLFFFAEVLEPTDSFVRAYPVELTTAQAAVQSQNVFAIHAQCEISCKQKSTLTINEKNQDQDQLKDGINHRSTGWVKAMPLLAEATRAVIPLHSPRLVDEVFLGRIERPPIPTI